MREEINDNHPVWAIFNKCVYVRLGQVILARIGMPFSKTTFMHIDYFQSKHFWQQKLTVFSNIGLKNVFYQFKRF